MKSFTGLASLVAMLAALVAGCGSSKPPATVGQSTQSPAAAGYAYARCMRSHGVPDFPDPKVSVRPGQVAVAVMAPRSEAGSPSFKAADKACSGILGSIGNPNPAQQRAREQDLLAFARCLRAHGIADFPDPNTQGQLTLTMIRAAGVDLHSRHLLNAGKACVGVTHGAITVADVAAAVNGTH